MTCGRIRIWIIAMTVPFLAGHTSAFAQAPSSRVTSVQVVTTDYTFTGIPTVIAAGPIMLSLQNSGKVRHEMSVVRLQPGVEMEAIQRGDASPASRAVAQSLIGILIARPGESAGGQLYVELRPGEHYLVICTLKDAPTGPPHSKLGMMTNFEVR